MATLADVIAQACGEAVAKALKDDEDLLTRVAQAGGDAASNGLLGDVETVTNILSNLLGDIPIIGGLLSDVANPVGTAEKAAGKFGRGFGLGWVVGSMLWQLLQPLMLPIEHEVNAHTTNELWDPATAAQLVARGLLGQQTGRDEAAGSGLDTPHFDALVEVARNRPALGELLRLLNLKAASEDDVLTALQVEGVPDFWRPKLLELRRWLLSPSDLALANLRGFMNDSTMAGYAEQLGVDPDDMAVLIANTGEPPGLMQLLEAFRRGFIKRDRLVHGIKQSRVRDEWIDVVEMLRYSPMPVADAINAAVRNVIPTEKAQSIADQNGLLPEDFHALLEAHGRPIADGQALELYNRGEMTAEQVKQVVRESDVKDKYVDYVLKLGRRLIPYRTINTILTHGIRDKAWGVKYLMQLGYTQDDADALASTATTAKTAALKSISEAQVMDLYEARDITADQAVELLRNIGYDHDESKYILDAIDAKATVQEQNKAISGVRAAVLATRITDQEASNQLDAIGVLAGRRDILLKDWKHERALMIRVPTEGQWASAVYYGVVTFDYARARLVAMGYSDDDARMLLDIRLHGIQPGTQPPTGAPPQTPPVTGP